MGENEERAFDCSHTILPDESSLQLLASWGGIVQLLCQTVFTHRFPGSLAIQRALARTPA
jgi:hypothetical protein